MKTATQIIGTVVLGILAMIGLGLAFAYPFMLLINYLFSPTLLLSVFGVAKIGFLRTFLFGIFTASFFKSAK